MLTLLKNWKGAVEINGTRYESIDIAFKGLNPKEIEQISIRLLPLEKTVEKAGNINKLDGVQEYRIKVKKYMTEKATPQFDFMAKWNNDVPMPLRIMVGTVDKETRGMVHMTLHGDMYAEQMCTCMKCGKRLTNKVSQYVGLGPECGAVIHMSLTEQDLANIEELSKEAKKRLTEVTWQGWVIRSSIIKCEEV